MKLSALILLPLLLPLVVVETAPVLIRDKVHHTNDIKSTCYTDKDVFCIHLRNPIAFRGEFVYSKGGSDDGELEEGGRVILYTEPTKGLYRVTCGGSGRVEFAFNGDGTSSSTAFGVLKSVLSDNPGVVSQNGKQIHSTNAGVNLSIYC